MFRKSPAAFFVALALAVSPHALAQEKGGVLTGKEKLAGKATDEQRVNNCKVPVQKRGAKARSDKCTSKGQAGTGANAAE